MSQQRHAASRARRSRAVAIPISSFLAKSVEEKLLALIHLLLALLAPFFILALTGCKSQDTGESVDYGPEATGTEINNALYEPLANVDPLAIKVGAFIHYSTTQSLAGGQVTNLLSDTGQTVVERQEDDTGVVYTIVQHKLAYGNNSQPEKTSTEFTIGFDKSSGSSIASVQSALNQDPLALLEQGVPALLEKLTASSLTPEIRQMSEPITYHRLVTSVSEEPPPEMVQNQAGCLGIPNCRIKVHHVEFDQVIWASGGPERIHFDLAMSPDVPMLAGLHMTNLFEYYPGLLKSCITLMVPVGDGQSKTLLTECNQVENFRFESPAP